MDLSKLQKGDKVVCEFEFYSLYYGSSDYFVNQDGQAVRVEHITKIVPRPVEFKTGLKISNRVKEVLRVIGVLDDRVYIKYDDLINPVAFAMDSCQKFIAEGTWKVLDQ